MYKSVEPMYEVYDNISKVDGYVSEMTRDDQGFLCGLLAKYKPKKIVEVGVAEGGTTVSVLKMLEILDLNSQVFSIDLATKLYYDYSLNTGFLVDKMGKYIKGDNKPTFLLGATAAAQMEKIGGDIDFCIIDTVHFLPGEMLDFLAVYPYLKDGAVVVLHDTNLDYTRAKFVEDAFHKSAYKATVTKLLFSMILADKYINMDCHVGVPNIAAFVINNDTRKYIKDVFFGLSLTWGYMPSDELLSEYRNCYTRNYDSDCLEMFDLAVEMNRVMVDNLPTHEW